MSSKLILLQLNEINFDLVFKYLSKSKKSSFRNLRIIENNYKSFNTYSEKEYDNLEPWIQWVSVNLGKDFSQHRIFRLGDIVNYPKEIQIYEKIEDKGFKVGAISPMNTENRLKNPAYFIPDPWTDTDSDNSNFSKKISFMLKQVVNDNSKKKISFTSVLTIIEIFFKTLSIKNSTYLIRLIFSSLFNPWKRSLVLDYIIHLIHIYFLKKKLPNFSSVFFNAGAHIQHHYFFNTKFIKNLPRNPSWYLKKGSDPIEDMLKVYDKIIGDYIELTKKGSKLIISTGLRQVPYIRSKFYYRLKNHSTFLDNIDIKYLKVFPRMTRDFEIIFDNNENLKNAKIVLDNIISKKDNLKIFGEIDERDNSLFVTLTYSNELKKNDLIVINENKKLSFLDYVVFVAIKNGMHDSKGYVFCSPNFKLKQKLKTVHISKLHDLILNNF